MRVMALAVIALCSFASCASSALAWRRPDGTVDEQELRADVDTCEARARTAVGRGRGPSSVGARPYGGWGNFEFEHCMNQLNWVLKPVAVGERPPPQPGS